MKSSGDKSYLIILYKIAVILTLLPPYNTCKNWVIIGHKYYATVVASILLIVSAALIYYRIYFLLDYEYHATTITLDAITNALLTTFICLAIINLSIVNTRKLRLFMKLLEEVSNLHGNCKVKLKYVSGMLFVLHTVVLIFSLIRYYPNTEFSDMLSFVVLIHDSIQQYFLLFLIIWIFNPISLLRINFKIVNCHLKSIFSDNKPFVKDISQLQVKGCYCKLEDIRHIYVRLCKLVNNFNTLFGWHLFFLSLVLVNELLEFINLLIIYLLSSQKDFKHSPTYLAFIISDSVWCLPTVVSTSFTNST